MRKWAKVKEWPHVSDVALRIVEKINATHKAVVTGRHPLESLEWGKFEAPTQLTGTNFENLDGRTDFRLISIDTFERRALLAKYAPIEAQRFVLPAGVSRRCSTTGREETTPF